MLKTFQTSASAFARSGAVVRSSLISMLALGSVAIATSAAANPVTYAVSGAYVGAGEGTFSGTFTYDATTNIYSAVNVTATAGVSAPSRTYTAVAASSASVARVVESPVVVGTSRGLPIVFSAPLTDAGGTVSIAGGTEGICLDAACTTRGAPFRNIASGSVSGTASVPTMTEWAMIMFGAILAGSAAFYIQRRKLIA